MLQGTENQQEYNMLNAIAAAQSITRMSSVKSKPHQALKITGKRGITTELPKD